MSNERTRNDINFDIRYGMRCAKLHTQFFGRLDSFLTLLQVIAMAAAVYSLVVQNPTAATVVGVLVAVSVSLQLVFRFKEKAIEERLVHDQFANLNANLPDLADAEAEKALRQLYRGATDELGVLRYLAYNDVIDELGLDASAKYEETALRKVMTAVAG